MGTFALFFETFIAAFLTYMPFTEKGLRTFPLMCVPMCFRSLAHRLMDWLTDWSCAYLWAVRVPVRFRSAHRWFWWLPALSFTLLIWVFDEVRKFIIRRSSLTSFAAREIYY